jgi:ADP-ribose pyrophosphatase YjhB (NUDIX family)
MYQSETLSAAADRPRVTVAAVVERAGRFLLVEERGPAGRLVINQPAGHVEGGESLLEAAVRETLEETGWNFEPRFLVGIYLWRRPDGAVSYLRAALAGAVDGFDPDRPLDDGIERTLWLGRDELAEQGARLRSPLVMKTVEDYLGGERYPLSVLKSLPSC